MVFANGFNEELFVGCIPETVEQIYFGNNYNRNLVIDGERIIPDTVTSLVFGGYNHNNIINSDLKLIIDNIRVIPDSVTYIQININFNQPLVVNGIKALPDSITEMTVTWPSPFIIDGIKVLPNNLKDLNICNIGHPLVNGHDKLLPNSIKYLSLDENIPIEHVIVNGISGIPDNVKFLRLSLQHGTNDSLIINSTSAIPNSVEELIFMDDLNIPLIEETNGYYVRVIPDSVKSLQMQKYNYPFIIDNIRVIPDSVQELKFTGEYDEPLVINGIRIIPDSVRKLTFCRIPQLLVVDDIRIIPNYVQEITLEGLTDETPIHAGDLPLSITKINLYGNPDKNIYLPYTIEEVKLHGLTFYRNAINFDDLFQIYYPLIKSAI